jgi:NADPH:quinone reductase-like Zn-dependent oxidoreductase
VQGAGGGTGHLAVQIAHAMGAEVTATASTGKQSWLRELGAGRTIDYTVDDVATLFPERPFDIVFTTSNGTARAGILATKPGGIVIDTSETVTDEDRTLAEATGVLVVIPSVSLNRAGLETLTGLADARRLVAHIDRVYPLADAADAHRYIEEGHATGKVLLKP